MVSAYAAGYAGGTCACTAGRHAIATAMRRRRDARILMRRRDRFTCPPELQAMQLVPQREPEQHEPEAEAYKHRRVSEQRYAYTHQRYPHRLPSRPHHGEQ